MIEQAVIERGFARFAETVARWSHFAHRRVEPRLDLLTERAELLNLPQPSCVSRNGSCRLIQTTDGWIAVSLPRPDDVVMVPALAEGSAGPDPWSAVSRYCARHCSADILMRARLLGLAIAAMDEAVAVEPSFVDDRQGSDWTHTPFVLDLSALWAGPLCGSILASAGCRVVKVETTARPDSTADRSPVFDQRLNGAKERLILDLGGEEGRRVLADLVSRADVLITSARPRGLRSLGVDPDLNRTIWIAIVAHEHDPDRIGFGDDCAVAGGLVGSGPDGQPVFLLDAVADPLTGVRGAGIALRALACRQPGRRIVALSSSARLASLGR